MMNLLGRMVPVAVVMAVSALMMASTAVAGEVTVEFPRESGSKTVSLASLTGSFDVDQDYEIRGASGSTQSERIRGISLAALLTAVNADPVYGGVEIVRPNGGTVLISKAQILAGWPAPVVYESAGEMRFLRPSYAAGDANAGDIVSTTGTLVVRQTDASRIQVKAKVSKSKVKARELVRFTAIVSGIGAGEQYSVEWNFRDGKKSTGESVSHRFSKRGNYVVLVTVKTEGSDRSDPTTVAVRVGDPAKNQKQRSGGGTNEVVGAPDSGASDGTSGSGENAASEDADSETDSQEQAKEQPAPEPELPQITGRLLDPNVAADPQAASTLAARSGQQVENDSGTIGVPGEALGVAATFGLLGLGFLLELGTFGRFRSRLTLGG